MSSNPDAESIQDFSHITNMPWVNKILKSSQAILHKTICEWASVVTQLTDNMEDINPWVQSLLENFYNRCSEDINDIRASHSKISDRIEQCRQKLETFGSILEIDVPSVAQKKLCLFQEYRLLKKYIDEYQSLIKDRKAELARLKKREQSLCTALGRAVRPFGENNLLSEAAVDEFENYVTELENEKFIRLEKIATITEEMRIMMCDLKYTPSSDFEQKIYQNDNNFSVTDEDMVLLKDSQCRLLQYLQNMTEEIDNLRENIEDLWNELNIDQLERERFRRENRKINLEVLETLRAEKQRCRDLKRAIIKPFIDKLRYNLLDIWSKCHCSEDVKIECQFFHTDCYTKDLLELHETELKKWTNFYEENRQLLSLIEKHKKLWTRMLELNENATGSQKYKNRGAQLLKEQKERNMLSKQIPKIEQDLLGLSRRYEEQTGKAFLTFGQRVCDYINSLHQDRETAKKRKLSESKSKLSIPPTQKSKAKPRIKGSNNSMQVINKKRRLSMKTISNGYGAFQNEMTHRVACSRTLLVKF